MISNAWPLQNLTISDPVALFGEMDAAKLWSSPNLFESARASTSIATALERRISGRSINPLSLPAPNQ
jgi:uncharacterized protein (DUF1810 family)